MKYAQELGKSRRQLREDCPRRIAEYLAVYVDKTTKLERQRSEEYWQLWERASRVPALEKEMQELAEKVRAQKLFETTEMKPVVRRRFRFAEQQ